MKPCRLVGSQSKTTRFCFLLALQVSPFDLEDGCSVFLVLGCMVSHLHSHHCENVGSQACWELSDILFLLIVFMFIFSNFSFFLRPYVGMATKIA